MTRAFQTIAVVLLVLGFAAVLHAANWSEPAAQFAREISAITGPGTASLGFLNHSSLSTDEVAEVRRALLAQLRSGGVRPVDANNAAAEVSVTFSENVAGYLWIAEIRQGTTARVVMRQVARTQPAALPSRATPSVVIRRTLLWSQAEPILDAALISGHLAVLDGNTVFLYKLGSNPEIEQTLPIVHNGVWPRDLRGRLVPASDHLFDAYLPGVICTSSAVPPLTMNCREGDDPWPLGVPQSGMGSQRAFFGAARNFFTGVLSPGIGQQSAVAPFYSAASFERPNYTLWLFAGIDGKVRQVDGVNERDLAAARDWGSSLAAVKSECGTVLLATAGGDSTAHDSVRAYELADREPAPAGQPADFGGPVTALWNSVNGGATAIVHNLKTDQYEAYSLSVACSQ